MYTVPLNYVGTILVCTAKGWPTPDVEWQKDGFSLSRESGIISEYNIVATDMSMLTRLMWTREFRNSDEGEYECILHQRNTSLKAASQMIELKAVTVHTVGDLPWTMCRSSVDEHVMYFQIRILGVECQTWMKSQKERIATQVQHELLSGVEYECNCAVDDRELQLIGMPQCSVQIDDAAVFHGVIQTNSLEKTRLIFCALSFWLESSAQLQIDGRFQAIDSNCPMEASETLNEECVPVETLTPSGNSVKEILAISGGIGGFIMIVILLITIVCCTGCYYQSRPRNMNSKCDGGVSDTKGVSLGQGDHTYDQ